MRKLVCFASFALFVCMLWFASVLLSAHSIPPPISERAPAPRIARSVPDPEPEPEPKPASAVTVTTTRVCFHTNTAELVTDDRGYVCSPFDLVQDSKCCNLAKPYVKRFSCDNCTQANCCSSFEICVLCCMGKGQGGMPERRKYQHCSSICRTTHDSLSQGKYANGEHHHCFERSPPKVVKDAKEERSEIEWMTLQ